MIREIASIDIKPGSEAAFEAAVKTALPLFETAKGCHQLRLERGVERPNHYVLIIDWDSLEDHTVAFKQSAAFAEWRTLVGPHFAAPPHMEHVRLAVESR